MATEGTLNVDLTIKIRDEDLARLDALASKMKVLKVRTIARSALLLGLAQLEKDPALVFSIGDETATSKGKKKP